MNCQLLKIFLLNVEPGVSKNFILCDTGDNITKDTQTLYIKQQTYFECVSMNLPYKVNDMSKI